MILVDTSVWIDHLHRTDSALANALQASQVAQHPMVVGELALGSLRDRGNILRLISALPQLPVATHEEVMFMVEDRGLYGQGLSLVDAHLLAAVRLAPGALLWTRDKKLRHVSMELGVGQDSD